MIIIGRIFFIQDDDKLRQEAEKDVVKPKLCRLEKSDDADVKKYFKRDPSNDKKSNKSNNSAPSSSREQSPAPQKLAPNPFSKAKKNEKTSPAIPAASPTPEKLVPNPFSSDKKKSTLTPAAAAATTPAPQKMVANPFHKGLDTIQDYLCELGMKPCMQLWEIIIFSLKHVIVEPTKIIKDLCEASTQIVFMYQLYGGP